MKDENVNFRTSNRVYRVATNDINHSKKKKKIRRVSNPYLREVYVRAIKQARKKKKCK